MATVEALEAEAKLEDESEALKLAGRPIAAQAKVQQAKSKRDDAQRTVFTATKEALEAEAKALEDEAEALEMAGRPFAAQARVQQAKSKRDHAQSLRIAGASTLTAEDMYNIALECQRTVSIGTLGKLRHSVFLVKESGTDNKGIGVGVFIGPNRAVTADHILPDGQTRVYAAMPGTSKLILQVVKRVKQLDYAKLSCEVKHDFLESYEGDPASLIRAQLALCTFSVGTAEDSDDDELAENFADGIGVMPASGVKLSKDNRFLVYTSTMWAGDSGGALVMHDGKLVGLHLDGVNHLKELMKHESADLPTHVGQLDASVKDVIRSVAKGCVAVLASSFK